MGQATCWCCLHVLLAPPPADHSKPTLIRDRSGSFISQRLPDKRTCTHSVHHLHTSFSFSHFLSHYHTLTGGLLEVVDATAAAGPSATRLIPVRDFVRASESPQLSKGLTAGTLILSAVLLPVPKVRHVCRLCVCLILACVLF